MLHAAAATSAPLTLRVLDPARMPVVQVPGAPKIDVTATNGPHYIDREIPLTLRITSGHSLQQGTIILPESGDFPLTRSGEDRISRTGSAQVLERTCVLRPQKSGPLTLPAFALRATLADPNGPTALWQQPVRQPVRGAHGRVGQPGGTGPRCDRAQRRNLAGYQG